MKKSRDSKGAEEANDKAMMKTARQLQKLREEIDAVDKLFMEKLAKRFKVVEAVGRLKVANGLPIYNRERMLEMLNGRKEDAERLNLDGKLIYNIFDLIHEASIKCQEDVAKEFQK